MSAPSKAGGVTSISKNEGNFQHNTLRLGEEEAVRSTEVEMFSHETFRNEIDAPKKDTMGIVMVDKGEMLLENVEKVDETDDRFAEEQNSMIYTVSYKLCRFVVSSIEVKRSHF